MKAKEKKEQYIRHMYLVKKNKRNHGPGFCHLKRVHKSIILTNLD